MRRSALKPNDTPKTVQPKQDTIQVQQGSEGLNLERALGVIRRRAPWIAICFVLAAGAVYGFSKHQTKKYTATASLVFNNNQLSQQVAGLQALNNSSNQQAQQNTNLKLVQLGDMAEKTASSLAGAKAATPLARDLTKDKVNESLSVSAQGESNIVNVTATATSPVLAAEIANTYSSVFVKEQQNSNHAYYASALKLVNKQLGALVAEERRSTKSKETKEKLSTAGVALQDRAQSLGVLAELKNGNVEVAQAATVPTSPSSPKMSRNTVLGGLLGLLLGLGFAFLLERFDRRIREPKDLEAIYGLPLLGVVPESKALSRSARRAGGSARAILPPGEAESFQLIRAHLRYFNVDRQSAHAAGRLRRSGRRQDDDRASSGGAAARVGSRVLLRGGRSAPSDARAAARRAVRAGFGRCADRRCHAGRGDSG